MGKRKLEILDKYQIAGIAIFALTMIMCQFREYVNDSWRILSLPQAWWSFFTYSLTRLGMNVASRFNMSIPIIPAFEHTKGILWIVFASFIGVSYFIGLSIGREFWAIAGILAAIVHGDKGSE